MFGEIAEVTLEQRVDVIGYQVEHAARGLGFAGCQATDAEIRMQAAANALEQFLVRFPCGGGD